MISRETLRSQILAVARQVHAWGFRSLAVINTHGGNVPVLIPTLREIRALYGLQGGRPPVAPVPGLSAQEATFGIHAGEVETSWVLAAALQHTSTRRGPSANTPRSSGTIPARSARSPRPALVAWASRDVSKSGVMGDATAATAEKGRRWLELGAAGYAEAIAEACRAGRPQPSP
jgi:creatinine amidohydrolase